MSDYRFGGESLERSTRDAERSMAKVGDMQARMTALVGRGEAAEGKVLVECTSNDGISKVNIDPRMLRSPSEEIGEQVRLAVNVAIKDLQTQMQELSKEIFGMDATNVLDPEEALAKVEELGNAYAGEMQGLLREITSQQARAKEAMERMQRR
jgi:DNA-binding protein YbaB